MKVRLSINHKKANVKSVVLHSDAIIGRSTECNLRLVSGQISRKHCQLIVRDDQVAVIDLGSSNGTYLNETRLNPKTETTVNPGDKISIGSVTFLVDYDDPSEMTHIRKSESPPTESTTEIGLKSPVAQESENAFDSIEDDSQAEVDEISDEELESLLENEGFEDDTEHVSIELDSDPMESEDSSFVHDESSSSSVFDNSSMLASDFPLSGSDTGLADHFHSGDTDAENDNDQNTKNFLQNLEDPDGRDE
ncbi:MAG: FHA domain-containing protein [Planctomycetaceae bacterium]|nr:FHA domain-containing protein [Planctomycetaceae bacterium]